ncbi:hypothetical protein WDW86_16525 [Bdellovibrionota bacterium FG-2]
MKLATLVSTVLVISLGTLTAAFAMERDFSNTVIRMERGNPTTTVSISGTLSCVSQENGTPCELQVRDSKSGKNFRLANATNAMRMHHDGINNVVIEGVIASTEQTANSLNTLEIKKIDRL